VRKFVLDTNCFIAASRSDEAAASLETFVQAAAPALYLSTVVAAELRAGTTRPGDLRKLEKTVLRPYCKRGRVINPSAAAWEALGKTLAWLVKNEASLFTRHREVSSSTFWLPIPAGKPELRLFLIMNEISSVSEESSPLNPHCRTLTSVELTFEIMAHAQIMQVESSSPQTRIIGCWNAKASRVRFAVTIQLLSIARQTDERSELPS